MDAAVRAVVEAIHATPIKAVLYFTGGASQALGWLLSVPGASNTVLEAVVPYSRHSMANLLGKVPAHFASKQVAEEMALLAYNRALKLSVKGDPVVGLGFTGSLASVPPKRGDHRFFLSTRTSGRLWTSEVTLTKGLRDREQEDKLSSHHVLMAIAVACSASLKPSSQLAETDSHIEWENQYEEDHQLEQLIEGLVCMKVYQFSKGNNFSSTQRKIILSGSFNPLHEGHLKLLEFASRMFADGYPCFEISAINADKPPLTVPQIKERVKQFEAVGKTVIVSNQPFFYKKAELFPGSVFVIGADTAARLVDPKYYDGCHAKMIEILTECKRIGTTFLVGGRKISGTFKVLEDLSIPDTLKEMFVSIPEDQFRVDLSSTEIRQRQNPNS